MVLDDVVRTVGLEDGAPVVAIAFGPGLTIYAALLRAQGLPAPR